MAICFSRIPLQEKRDLEYTGNIWQDPQHRMKGHSVHLGKIMQQKRSSCVCFGDHTGKTINLLQYLMNKLVSNTTEMGINTMVWVGCNLWFWGKKTNQKW